MTPTPSPAALQVADVMGRAALQCLAARARHMGSECVRGASCRRCAGLEWAAQVFRYWRRPDIGADDLAAAVRLLESEGRRMA